MSSLFDAVKDAVTMPEIARAYGYVPNRSGFVCCPFHSEKTPSMKIYRRNFHCFGCGAHGTTIDFVASLFGLSPLDAAKKLDNDFTLHLVDDLPSRADMEMRRQLQNTRQLYDEWREKMLNQMDAVIRVANLADYEALTAEEAIAIKYRDAFEFWAGILLHGNIAQQMGVFRDRKEVERLCRMILQNTPPRSRTA